MNEYLSIYDGGLSYIVTSLNVPTLQELSGIMNMVGELGPGCDRFWKSDRLNKNGRKSEHFFILAVQHVLTIRFILNQL